MSSDSCILCGRIGWMVFSTMSDSGTVCPTGLLHNGKSHLCFLPRQVRGFVILWCLAPPISPASAFVLIQVTWRRHANKFWLRIKWELTTHCVLIMATVYRVSLVQSVGPMCCVTHANEPSACTCRKEKWFAPVFLGLQLDSPKVQQSEGSIFQNNKRFDRQFKLSDLIVDSDHWTFGPVKLWINEPSD